MNNNKNQTLGLLVAVLSLIIQLSSCSNNIEGTDNDQEMVDYLRNSGFNMNSKISLHDLASLVDNNDGNVNKRGGVWFGPRLGKRSKRSIKDSSDSMNELFSDEQIELPEKFNFESFQNSPWVILLLSEKQSKMNNKNHFLTPRLGRDASENMVEIHRAHPPFAPRLGKKSLPFNPRLGRQLYEIVQQK